MTYGLGNKNNEGESKVTSVITMVSSDGSVSQYQMPGGKCLYNSVPEPGNELFCIDYNSDGSMFAVAGKDHRVYVYDDEKKEIVNNMHEGLKELPGHGNRVFAIKFDPQDPNVIVSGGWDKTL
jgi:COMPASS component SWD3